MIDVEHGATLASDHLHCHRTGRCPDPPHEPRHHPATLPTRRRLDRMRGQVVEPEGGAAQVFEPAVDRFGGPLLVPGRSK
jgi:hypothetical protein